MVPRRLAHTTFTPPLLAAVLAVVLAACGGGGTSSTRAAGAGSSSTSAAASSISTTTSTTTTTAPATSTAAGPPACRAADLALRFLGAQGATGHGELGFALKNTSGHTCGSFGYPGIQWLTRGGAPLPTQPQHVTTDFFGHSRLAAVTLAPGQEASFRLGVTHGMASPVGCTTAYGLQVIPPNDTATLRITIPQDGTYECRVTTVSPLRAGTSAYP